MKVNEKHLDDHTPLDYVPLGDSAVRIRFGEGIDEEAHLRALAFADAVRRRPFPGFVEALTGYCVVTVFYDPFIVYRHAGCRNETAEVGVYATICRWLSERQSEMETTAPKPSRFIEIPVWYGGENGPDLEEVARHCGMTAQEAVALHCEAEYKVYMIGFTPGFPYLGGLPKKLATPRRNTPRMRVPAGSVGIGGSQTGVYPLETPGGWHIIGRTPLALFLPERDPPSLLRPGDRVRFVPIGEKGYRELERSGGR